MKPVWRVASRPGYAGPLLLDTHLWVWMLDPAAGRLPPAVVPLLRRAAAADAIHVSDISYWEVGQKAASGRLVLTSPVALWTAKAQSAPGVHALPLTRDVLLLSTALTTLHRDPADRMLVATAKLTGIPLATLDSSIVAWAEAEGETPVVDCRPRARR
ncbi:MAG: type II toxin-antitoxin system VapC family toxin [Gemmatimonadales bacterium]|nr:type II toxin-antitoxin system VapC family toxin [Gemmatimonadales bacterium]